MVFANENRNIKSLGQTDLILLPDLTGFSSSSYERGKELADRGYQAAQGKASFPGEPRGGRSGMGGPDGGRASRRRPEWIQPKFVDVQGMVPAENQHEARNLSAPTG